MEHNLLHKIVYFTLFAGLYFCIFMQYGCGGISTKSKDEIAPGASKNSFNLQTGPQRGIIDQVTDMVIVVSLIALTFYCTKQLAKGSWAIFGGQEKVT